VRADLAGAAAQAGLSGDAVSRIKAVEALARAEFATGRTDAAKRSAGLAVSLGRRFGWEEGLFRLYALQGQVLARQGDQAGAQGAYGDCSRSLAQLEAGLSPGSVAAFRRTEAVREAGAVCTAHVAPAAVP
jgi:hypothetical protein